MSASHRPSPTVFTSTAAEPAPISALADLHRLVWAERGESIEDCIEHEKRLKRWRRDWKFALIERANPDWDDLFETLA